MVTCDADKWSSNKFDAVMEKQTIVAGSHIKPIPRAQSQTIQENTIKTVGTVEGKSLDTPFHGVGSEKKSVELNLISMSLCYDSYTS